MVVHGSRRQQRVTAGGMIRVIYPPRYYRCNDRLRLRYSQGERQGRDLRLALQCVVEHAVLALRLPHGVHHSDPDEGLITGAGVHAFESAASMVIRFTAIMMLAGSVVTVAFSRPCGMALRYSSTARSSALARLTARCAACGDARHASRSSVSRRWRSELQ